MTMSLINELKLILKNEKNYISRDHGTMGGLFTVDTWEFHEVFYQLMDEGYSERIFKKNVIDVIQTYNREPVYYIGTEKDLQEVLNLIKTFEKE
jgi:hypothetical protein